jgi:hypothetical protein
VLTSTCVLSPGTNVREAMVAAGAFFSVAETGVAPYVPGPGVLARSSVGEPNVKHIKKRRGQELT